MQFDLPLEQLQQFRPPREEPDDFDAFWARTLAETRAYPLEPRFEPVDFGLRTLETYDVTFSGYRGQPIKGWLLLPRNRSGPLPGIVEFIGYGGGRGFPFDWLLLATAGYAHLVMDTRGQGSVWQRGDTPDPETDGANPQAPGFLTRGVLRPETYYYRRVFADAVRAVETASAHPAVDGRRLAVAGGSQGGGIALAAAGLVSGLSALLADVPFLCCFRRATIITDAAPYRELATFCATHRDRAEEVFTTLSYFDGVNFAARAGCPALFSTALMDDVCPPSTVFAAYNHYAGPKDICVWPFNDHSGGQSYQRLEQLRFLARLWS